MAQYAFVTVWRIEAPIEPVWGAIHGVEGWPAWWSFVANVVEIEPGDENGLGAVHRFDWKTRLPYTLSFESRVTQIEKPCLLDARVDGELMGRGLWRLSEAGEMTVVRHDWEVSTRKPWMNWLAPLARPAFKWNHAAVMRDGRKGLARHLGARLLGIES
jgi:hypothetical protein